MTLVVIELLLLKQFQSLFSHSSDSIVVIVQIVSQAETLTLKKIERV